MSELVRVSAESKPTFQDQIKELKTKIASAQEPWDLPLVYDIVVLGEHVINDENFNTEVNGNFAVDPQLREVISLLPILAEKYSTVYGKQKLRWDWHEFFDKDIERKKAFMDMLSPGHFFAHGAYVNEFFDMIKSHALMSSVARINAGFLNKDKIPRWGKVGSSTHPDAAAVFFYPWIEPDLKAGKPPAGVYSATSGDPRGTTDMTLIYPTESIIKHAKAINIRGGKDSQEIAVTCSEDSLKAGTLVNTGDDATVLPIEDAYLVIPSDKKVYIQSALEKEGYPPEWIKRHVYSYERGPGFDKKYGIFYRMVEEKSRIDQWLATWCKPSDKKVLLGKLPRVTTNGGVPGDLYIARLA